MFTKILIANRGEIACRVISTARCLGIQTVAVYSDADEKALHVKLADEAIYIGASPSSESYLVGDRIIAAALQTGAQAIHPGYGFLSENAEFAENCSSNGITFIGPPTKAIESMGSKSAAKSIMENANVPLVPGYHGDNQDPKLIKQWADDIGYPVLLKAVAGGGGKGMRQVWSADEFDQALAEAKRESKASFGNDDMLVEKYLTQPRHVEFQVFCDQHGNGVYLFERDCSVQRRHQKVIEEAPAPGMSESLRKLMGETAVRAAQAIDYQGAGTVEFLLDVDDSFFFMEMNTRLQVEHPVTEMITGEDLVEWQLRVANGEPLPKKQTELKINGHAFESRVYAEDPNNDFLPTAGTLKTLKTPEQNEYLRVDSGVVQGDEISPYYDPMIAKLIVWGEDRTTALARTAKALREYQISGITTNLNFLYDLATSKPFIEADLDTGFIEKHQHALFKPINIDLPKLLSHAACYLTLNELARVGSDPWSFKTAWRMNQRNLYHYDVKVREHIHHISIEPNQDHLVIQFEDQTVQASASLTDSVLTVNLDGHKQSINVTNQDGDYTVFYQDGVSSFSLVQPDCGNKQEGNDLGNFTAPMNGTIVEVLVSENENVTNGQVLVVIEAMKMQHSMIAPSNGVVSELFCAVGDLVDGGATLLDFKPTD